MRSHMPWESRRFRRVLFGDGGEGDGFFRGQVDGVERFVRVQAEFCIFNVRQELQGLLEYGHVRRAAEGMVFYVVEVVLLLAVDAGDVRLGRGRGLLGYDVFLGDKGEVFFLRLFQEGLEGLAEFFVAEIDWAKASI